MEKLWETLVEFTEFKYPDSLKYAATLSNRAVMLYDFVIKRDARKKETVLNGFATSAQIVSRIVAPYVQEHRDEKEDGSAEVTYTLSALDKDHEQIAAYVVLLHNYIMYLRLCAKDIAAVQRNSHMMIQISLMNEFLSEKERSNLAIERSVAGMHIIPIMKAVFEDEFLVTLENSAKYMVKKVISSYLTFISLLT